MAAVRLVLRLRLPQFRPLRRVAAATAQQRRVTEIPAELLPERPKPVQPLPADPALREYNAYLAELAKKDAEKENRTTA